MLFSGPVASSAKDSLFWRLNRSLDFDRRLFRQDIAGSLAHVRMLARRRIIPARDARRIERGLAHIRRLLEMGRFRFRPEDEDIHMAVERALIETVGPAGGRLHTARSRNDQVALDLRLYLRDEARRTLAALAALVRALARQGRRHLATLMPAYTHLQRGQATTVAHHLSAYAEMFLRDMGRFRDLLGRLNVSPLGSGACTGTTFPVDREGVARALGFADVTRNSLDGVSDRDFVMEYQAAAAILAVHLSRLGEEVVLWTSSEFGFASLPEALTSGSSMMPNKRNPDGAELLRGKSGRVFGNLVRILTVMKGLPLSYNKDLQEDKEGVFDTVDTLDLTLPLAARLVEGIRFDRKALRAAVESASGWILATEAADALVRKGVPFRKAHGIVKAWVDAARESGKPLSAFTAAELKRVAPELAPALARSLSVWKAVEGRKLPGGPAPETVTRQLRQVVRDAGRLAGR